MLFRSHRLFRGATTLGITIPYSIAHLEKVILTLIAKNKLTEGYIRPIVFFGKGWIKVDPSECPSTIAIIPFPMKKFIPKTRCEVKISPIRRLHPQSTYHNEKLSGNYLNSVLAIRDARKSGYDEALLLDHKGYVAEGSAQNIFFVQDGKLITPQKGSILNGITRQSIITIAKDHGLEIIEKKIRKQSLTKFQEAFFTGTAVGIHSIHSINNHHFGKKQGPITTFLSTCYDQITHGRDSHYSHWIQQVK